MGKRAKTQHAADFSEREKGPSNRAKNHRENNAPKRRVKRRFHRVFAPRPVGDAPFSGEPFFLASAADSRLNREHSLREAKRHFFGVSNGMHVVLAQRLFQKIRPKFQREHFFLSKRSVREPLRAFLAPKRRFITAEASTLVFHPFREPLGDPIQVPFFSCPWRLFPSREPTLAPPRAAVRAPPKRRAFRLKLDFSGA